VARGVDYSSRGLLGLVGARGLCPPSAFTSPVAVKARSPGRMRNLPPAAGHKARFGALRGPHLFIDGRAACTLLAAVGFLGSGWTPIREEPAPVVLSAAAGVVRGATCAPLHTG